jgi:teichuronic acid biosynthesis glycosyltransferase TuaC
MMVHSSMPATPTLSASKALHVLTLTPFYPRLGDEANGCFIAEPLPWNEKRGISQSVLAVRPFYRGGGKALGSFHPARWKTFFSLPSGIGLPSAGAFLFASILPEVRRLHASHPVHVIHAHGALPCGHAATLIGREMGIPFVVTVHGLDAYSTKQVSGLPGRWCERVSRMVYRSAQTVICVSEKVREQVLAGAKARVETEVVYNGVDAELFSPSRESADYQTILSVGTLIPSKGYDVLLRAFAQVDSEFPAAALKIIGEGAERQHLAQLSSELNIADKVTFVGRQTRRQIADAMKQCALFALPSRYEGLGCVYLEAMATGKPAIGCSDQGIDEIIHNGFNGLLVAPDDLTGLANALRQLLQNPQLRASLGQSARRSILHEFTLAHQASRLAEIYQGSAK